VETKRNGNKKKNPDLLGSLPGGEDSEVCKATSIQQVNREIRIQNAKTKVLSQQTSKDPEPVSFVGLFCLCFVLPGIVHLSRSMLPTKAGMQMHHHEI
jgi:hypothetical protein